MIVRQWEDRRLLSKFEKAMLPHRGEETLSASGVMKMWIERAERGSSERGTCSRSGHGEGPV